MVFKYGWLPDLPDARDVLFKAGKVPLPDKVFIEGLPPVFNQYQLGSCTANAVANAHLYCQMKQPGGESITPSRLFIYYNARKVRGWEKVDSGSSIRDAVKQVNKLGTCSEEEWPYIVEKFNKKPEKGCYIKGKEYQVLSYYRVAQTLKSLKECLALGFPVVLGISLFESFESEYAYKTGDIGMPDPQEQFLGGHAVLCVGYDDEKQRFHMMNSWGVDWGNKGFFTLPYNYLLNKGLAADFWTIRFVEEGNEENGDTYFNFSDIALS
jgi:C1A family cysteine protease